MKGLSYSFLRAICALVIGLVLVMFPDQAGDYFVITIGVIFLVPSLISIIGYYAQAAEVRRRFPVEGVGSLLFGLWLIIMPGFFCRFVDVCIGLYSCDGRCAADSIAFGCPTVDTRTGWVLCCSGVDIACRTDCFVQSYRSAFYGIYNYRDHQFGLCGFGIDKLV